MWCKGWSYDFFKFLKLVSDMSFSFFIEFFVLRYEFMLNFSLKGNFVFFLNLSSKKFEFNKVVCIFLENFSNFFKECRKCFIKVKFWYIEFFVLDIELYRLN